MQPNLHAPNLPLSTETGTPGLDIVVPFTTRPLTRAALSAAGRFAAGLLPLIRMACIQVVPFPLELEAAPGSAPALRDQYALLAEEFGAHVQICLARGQREGLLHVLSEHSVVLIAARRRWWNRLMPSKEERLAKWLRNRGYRVMLEFVEKNNA
jgi:hypothetical protein